MVSDPVSGQNVPSRSRRQTIMLPALGNGIPRVDTVGDTPIVFGTLSTLAGITGIFAKYTAPASVNSRCGIACDVQYMRALNIQAYVSFKINHLTNNRIFIGFSDQTLSTMTNTDSPPGKYFGLWFSYNFNPNNLYAIASDGINFPVRTQIATIDSLQHDLYLRLFADSPGSQQVQLQVDDNTMDGIKGTGLVPNTTLLAFMAGMITLDGGAKSLQLGKIQVEQAA